ncbi:MAG TPA: four-helix bundle copper-binding protein [Gammaproteobacteria bacterium]
MKTTLPSGTPLTPSRRTLLKGAGGITALAALGVAQQALAASSAHEHHHHVSDDGRSRLIDSALACIKTGDACSHHCIELFKSGDTSLAGCADSVQEMLATCHALTKLAAYDSRHLQTMVQLCMSVAQDCEKECRKHETKHVECKACAEACAECIKECKAYLA